MVLPVAALALGSLLGGGTQQTQTTTVSSSNTNSFNPNIVFGGDASIAPTSPVVNDFVNTTTTSQTQEQADPASIANLLNPAASALGGILPTGSAPPVLTSSLGVATSNLGQTGAVDAGFPVELLVIGGIGLAAYLLFSKSSED